jgi:ankyrin repeat protein
VRLLIKARADVNTAYKVDTGWTPLFLAAYFGYTDVVQLLLDARADVHVTDKDGDSPLTSATKKGHTEIVRLLQEAASKE